MELVGRREWGGAVRSAEGIRHVAAMNRTTDSAPMFILAAMEEVMTVFVTSSTATQ